MLPVGNGASVTGGRRVLLVDDDPDILESLKTLLEVCMEPRVEVVTAPSGVAGLEVLRGGAPVDLIVSDYRMPGMSGAEFLARARELAPQTPRLMISAYPESTLKDDVARAGLAGFLPKPMETEAFLDAARRWLP